MVVVFAVLCPRLRIKEIIAGNELKDLVLDKIRSKSGHEDTGDNTNHGSHAPDVGTRAPFGSENDFG